MLFQRGEFVPLKGRQKITTGKIILTLYSLRVTNVRRSKTRGLTPLLKRGEGEIFYTFHFTSIEVSVVEPLTANLASSHFGGPKVTLTLLENP